MAQEMLHGFLVDSTTKALVVTTSTAGATVQGGFLRDSSGRLVVK